jgi:sec-independent protein translocase protein TatA
MVPQHYPRRSTQDDPREGVNDMSFGSQEMIIVMVVLLLLFGGSRLPKLARSIGEARKELRHVVEDDNDDL